MTNILKFYKFYLRHTKLMYCLLVAVLSLFAFGVVKLPSVGYEVNFVMPDGSTHTGSLKNGKANGEGEIKFANGIVYRGGFKDGAMFGDGELTGLKDGGSMKTHVDGDDTSRLRVEYSGAAGTYSGELVNGLPSGDGELKVRDSFDYLGGFSFGELTGKAEITFKDGSHYSGDIKDGVAEGHGGYEDIHGWRYSGGWKNGVFSGRGTVSFNNGEKIDKVW